MENKIKELAALRAKLEEVKTEKYRIVNEFEKSDAYVKAAEEMREVQKSVSDLEQEIKDTAVTQFDADGNKAPHPAVAIKTFTVLDYDEKHALAWSRENFQFALKLDKRIFEGLKKTDNLPDFVEVKDEPRAQIKTDLSDYLT